ncbi:DMT family transporter [Cohaesibacter sp. CAU 1516]|uniref:DMT family transporter n=1 Tax=Cohaesibacter sp. CAU 1516 TaxID=2576038 RepID=UPI0010FE58DA|nr:DMT family transporter [Cohaesibacter sp. CAU 1516]TLP43034.1 DMT family transporter [Cohaesibacter sp. CAU 1516]
MQSPTLRHWLMLAILILSWGSAILLTRVAVNDLPPLWVTAGRVTTGAATLLAYRLIFVRKPFSLGWHHLPWLLWLALLSSALPFLLIAWGTQYTSAAIAGILMGTIPLSVLGLAHILLPDEKLTRNKAIGFLIGFIGVVLIINPTAGSLSLDGNSELIGQIAIFIASFCYALNSVSTRRMPPADNIDKATAVLITASLILIALCLLFEPFTGLDRAPMEKWLILLYLGIVPTALATLVLFVLLSQTSAGFVATSNYMIPIVTALGGMFFLGESLALITLIGFAIILLGLLLSQRKGKARQQVEPAE